MKKRLFCLALLLALCASVWAQAEIAVDPEASYDEDGVAQIGWQGGNGGRSLLAYTYLDDSSAAEQETNYYYSYSNPATIGDLIPGAQYSVEISDTGNNRGSGTVRIPLKGSCTVRRNIKTKAWMQYKKDPDVSNKDAKTVEKPSAADMKNKLEKGGKFGVAFRFTFYDRFDWDVAHKAVVALRAPNGAVWSNSATFTEPELGARIANVKTYYFFLGDELFDFLLEKTGDIPTGVYRVELYVEGALLCADSVTVKK